MTVPVPDASFSGSGGVVVGVHGRGVDRHRPVGVPVASALACAAWSVRVKVPFLAHRRKRVCGVVHGPYRSGRSGQATLVRNFHTVPLGIVRSSRRFRLRDGTGSSGCMNSRLASGSSWRRITPP